MLFSTFWPVSVTADTNLEKAILEAVRPALIHLPNQMVERLHHEVRQFRRVILISVSPVSPNSRATRQLSANPWMLLGTTACFLVIGFVTKLWREVEEDAVSGAAGM
jgi:hypothetical protein